MKILFHKVTPSFFLLVILLIVSFFFLSTKTFAATVVSDDLTADTVWTKIASPYLVSSLTIPAGIKLTLEPGVIVKFGSTSKNDSFTVLGTLEASGTVAEPVYFTSVFDHTVPGDALVDGENPNPGDWAGMIIKNGGTANFNHAVIRYGGYFEVFMVGLDTDYISYDSILADAPGPLNYQANIYNNGGILHIINSVIESSRVSGVRHGGGETTVNDSVFRYNSGFGVFNLTENIISAQNNYWNDPLGPYYWDMYSDEQPLTHGDSVSDNVNYTPWLTVDPTIPTAPKKTPVIIIPGILSSYLNENTTNTEVWPNLVKAFMPFGDDSYLDELAFNQDGQPDLTKPTMLPTDIFRKVTAMNFTVKDFFDSLIGELSNNGYMENNNLFVFPYDWRLSVQDNVDNVYSPLLTSLKDKVDQVLAQTGAQKVDIVAHSMGGLLAKYYIEHYGQGKVDKFVDIATPHLGAPSAANTLVYGDDIGIKFGWFGLNPLEMKKISQNSPAVYQLLPSAKYFSDSLSNYNYYLYDMDDYDNDGIRGQLTFNQSLDFLKNTGRNDLVMNPAVNIHNDLDNVNPADYGVKTFNIVGCGSPTIGKIFTLGKESDTDEHYDLAYITGDGTVPQRSAEAIPSQELFYASKTDHGTMPSTSGIKELVGSLLAGTENDFDFSTHANIATTTNDCTLPDGTQIEIHSPVDLNIYDSAGNHTGPNANGDLEENIPNIAYDIIDGNKFAYLPDGENYRINLQATAVGTFSSHIKKIENGEVTSTAYFADLTLQSTSTTAEMDISYPNPTITLDQTGDGSVKETINSSSVIAGDSLADLTAPETVINIIGTSTDDGSYEGDVSIDFSATDADSGILKTEYSTDNGLSYTEATSTVIISAIGTTTVLYRSIDKAGNIEVAKSVDIVIAEPVVPPGPEPEPDPIPDPVPEPVEPTSNEPVITAVRHSGGGGYVNQPDIMEIASSTVSEQTTIAPVMDDLPVNIPKLASKIVPVNKAPVETLLSAVIATTTPSLPMVAAVGAVPEKVKPIILVVIAIVLVGALVFINKKYIMKV